MAMFGSARRLVPLTIRIFTVFAVALMLASGPAHAQDARARISALNTATVQLLNAGKLSEAVANAERALAEAEKTLRPDDPLIGQSLNNLAILLGHARHDAEAEPTYGVDGVFPTGDPATTVSIWQTLAGVRHLDRQCRAPRSRRSRCCAVRTRSG